MRILGKCTIVLLALALLAGCTWTKKFFADADAAPDKPAAEKRG